MSDSADWQTAVTNAIEENGKTWAEFLPVLQSMRARIEALEQDMIMIKSVADCNVKRFHVKHYASSTL